MSGKTSLAEELGGGAPPPCRETRPGFWSTKPEMAHFTPKEAFEALHTPTDDGPGLIEDCFDKKMKTEQINQWLKQEFGGVELPNFIPSPEKPVFRLELNDFENDAKVSASLSGHFLKAIQLLVFFCGL